MRKWGERFGMICLTLLLVGCGPQAADPPPPVVLPLAKAEPRQEARLHLPADPGTLDSVKALEPTALDLLGNLMEGLVRQGEHGETVPAVAERWESADGQTYTFFLRENARWNDGRRVTAGDFVFAWLRALDPLTASDQAFRLYAIAGAEAWNALDPAAPGFSQQSADLRAKVAIEAVDDRTLRIRLRAPDPTWLLQVAHPVFYPQRATQVSELGEKYGRPGSPLLSNGPFQLDRWVAGSEIRLRANLAYWDAGRVRLESLSFRVESDPTTLFRLLEVGELDMAYLPGLLAGRIPDASAMAQPATVGLAFNLAQPPLSNVFLRRAISLAIDRKRLLEKVAPGSTQPAAGLVPPSLANWSAPQQPIPPAGDPEEARQLWDRAQEEIGTKALTVRLLHAEETSALALELQAMLQEQLNGLTVQLEAVPFAERVQRVGSGQFDLVLQSWIADYDDPRAILDQFRTDSPANDARWANPEFDQALLRAQEGRPGWLTAVREAEQVLQAELPVVPLYHPVRYWLVGRRLKGLRHFPVGARIDLRSAELGS